MADCHVLQTESKPQSSSILPSKDMVSSQGRQQDSSSNNRRGRCKIVPTPFLVTRDKPLTSQVSNRRGLLQGWECRGHFIMKPIQRAPFILKWCLLILQDIQTAPQEALQPCGAFSSSSGSQKKVNSTTPPPLFFLEQGFSV